MKLFKRLLTGALAMSISFSLAMPAALAAAGGTDDEDDTIVCAGRMTPEVSEVTAGSLSFDASHTQYMEGNDVKEFMPLAPLTRAEAVQLLSNLVTTEPSVRKDVPYTDVDADKWYAGAFEKLYSLGILKEDSTIQPEVEISRAEFIDLIVAVGRGSGLIPAPAGEELPGDQEPPDDEEDPDSQEPDGTDTEIPDDEGEGSGSRDTGTGKKTAVRADADIQVIAAEKPDGQTPEDQDGEGPGSSGETGYGGVQTPSDPEEPDSEDPEPADPEEPDSETPEPADPEKPDDQDPEPPDSETPGQTDGIDYPDVPDTYWAAEQIEAATKKGWIHGRGDGLLHPESSLTRAEVCTAVNLILNRSAGQDEELASYLSALKFTDVEADYWAAAEIAEASIPHKAVSSSPEVWDDVDMDALDFRGPLGFREVGDRLVYFDREGKLLRNTTLGAYTIDDYGVCTQTADSYQLEDVPYISQVDDIYAWVGCEPVSALMGLKSRGFAMDVDVRTFLDQLPKTDNNPEKGFVGSPYQPDNSKRTTIYPAILAEYCNTYTGGLDVCADFRGASVEELQRELLAGNPVVAYETLWWAKPRYVTYTIDGERQSLVRNNHAILVYGYDPDQGYLVSDPYNLNHRYEVYQYWEDAQTFESIWNERKVGMVIR